MDSSVYLVPDGREGTDPVLQVAPPARKHVTADMHWGSGWTEDLLFASSACLADVTGIHLGFDVDKSRAVMSCQ